MLEDDIKKSSERALEAEIGEPHMQRFHKIRDRMSRGEFGRLYGDGSACPDFCGSHAPELELKEQEFHKLLVKHRDYLFYLLGTRRQAKMLHEVDLAPYGRCDFVVMDGRNCLVLEVKLTTASHSMVGQLDKYILAKELDMCLGRYDKVAGVAIATGFDPYVSSEFSRMGVKMIAHNGSPWSMACLS
jgi:hypothetical protein